MKNKYFFILIFNIGIIFGQITTAYALNPLFIFTQIIQLVRNAYKMGCEESNGKECLSKTDKYEKTLHKIETINYDY